MITAANALDASTDAAYTNTMNRLQAAVGLHPVGLTRAMFPGATQGNFDTMAERLTGNDNTLKAAAVGYVIEDQVTAVMPADVASQVGVGRAIPDFVITKGADGARRRGIVDVTSTGQKGHVLDKNFAIGGFELVWEALYPSINFNALGAGPVALAPETLASVNAAKQRRANSYVSRRLYRVNRALELLGGGVMYRNRAFKIRAERLHNWILALPNVGQWSPIYIGVTNNYIGQVNALLPPLMPPLETLGQIIANAQNRYLVGGNPRW